MKAHNVTYKPIGTVHSPFRDIRGMPIQPSGASGIRGSIEVDSDYVAGLKDLEGFGREEFDQRVRELGIEEERFTLDGKPTFLLGISYYGALGAPEAFVDTDLRNRTVPITEKVWTYLGQ